MINQDGYRIVVYGDSITKGVIFDEERQRYTVMEDSFTDLIKKECKGVIHGVGKFGNTIMRAVDKLHRLVINKKPDIVLLEFGGNDCDFDWEEIAQNPQKEHNPKTELSLFQQTLKETVETIKENNAIPVLMSLPPLDAERYFKWISKNDPWYAKNILRWLETVSRIYWWHERYNAAVMRVAEETNSKLIDIRGAFLEKTDYRSLISIDGIHPNQSGHKVIARKIIEYTKEKYDFLIK